MKSIYIGVPVGMEGNGHFGNWFIDEFGLPAYEYTCNQAIDPVALYFTTGGYSVDHWHQLGNDRLNILAHNDGSVEVVEGSRGLQWLSRRDPTHGRVGGGIGIVQETGYGNATWSDLFSEEKYRNGYRRVFGTGYFRKTTQRNGIGLDHLIYAPFGDDPVIVSESNIINRSNKLREITFYDYWGVNIHTIISALIYFDRYRKHFSKSGILDIIGKLWKTLSYASRRAPEQIRYSFSTKFRYQPKYSSYLKAGILKPEYNGLRKPQKDAPNSRNYYPKPVFLSALDSLPTRIIMSARSLLDRLVGLDPHEEPFRDSLGSKETPALCLGVPVTLRPGEARKLTFLFGYAEEDRIPEIIEEHREKLSQTVPTQASSRRSSPGPESQPTSALLKESSDKWSGKLIEFNVNDKKYEWLNREAKWHSYYLRSATLYDEYFENHLLPQGGAYGYLQGLQGAPRDFMVFAVAMTYFEPRLARETIEYTLRLMGQDGKIPYMTHGFGETGGAIVHRNPSDLALFLLWAISEYIFATRDFGFLDKEIPFYPKAKGIVSTVYARLKLAVDFVFDEVGVGEHGLIRVGDGDWNDGISTMVRKRREFIKKGESMFNTALALYVLPRVSLLFEMRHDKRYSEIIETNVQQLREAIFRSWNGKWFYRGWDGTGEAIGSENIFLEPLTWLLISGALPEDQARSLIGNIYEKLDKPSPFGQRLVSPPVATIFNYLERGWDVNGGVWFAMNYLLAWGYSKYDVEKAWNAFVKNSMKQHADLYPSIWYGIWSGPDAFNASYSDRSGETYYHLATPTPDFPVMNLNLHANFLMALIKLAGVEPTIDGISLSRCLPFRNFTLRTPVLELVCSERMIQGSYLPQAPGELTLRVKIPGYEVGSQIRCLVDGEERSVNIVEEVGICELKVDSRGSRFKFEVSCKPP